MNFGGYENGASQFGGGGFMTSPAGAADNQYGGGGKKANVVHSLRALTIRHLLKSNSNPGDDRFTADGHDIGTVTLVGRLVSIQEQSTKLVLRLDDGTGSIEVVRWLDETGRAEFTLNTYVRVFGTLKTFEGRISITSFAIKPVTDHNEVTYHHLQCIMQHNFLTKGAPPAAAPVAGGQTTPGRTPYGAPAGGAFGGPAAQPPAAAANRGPAASGPGDLHGDVKAVFNMQQHAAAPNGINVDVAVEELRRMGRAYTPAQVAQACDYLATEGVLYSTVNDHTFRTTGM